MPDVKPWYASKTIWVNIILMVGMAYQMLTGQTFATAEEQGAVIIVINFILRLVTKTGLT